MAILPIGFFAPLPLAIMIPFMAAQSFAMGHAFGTSFQYGKRKISSMTNEEFNATDAVTIHDTLQADIRAMIPSMNESFHRMETFQVDIIESMVKSLLVAAERFFEFVSSGFQIPSNQTSNVGDASLGIPDFIPTASATDSGLNSGTQKFASDYEREAMRLGFKLLLQIVKTFGTRTDIPIEKRVGYLAAFKILEERERKPVPATAKVAIEKSGIIGINKQIALLYTRVVNLLAALGKSPTTGKLTQVRNHMSAYNRFVTQTRNPNTGKTYANLQIDSQKSVAARRPIPKT